MNRSFFAPAGLLVGTALLGGWLLQDGVDRDRNLYEQARVFQEVVDRVSREYVDEVTGGALYEDAIDGILGALDDPYSYVFEPEQYEQFRIQTEGGYAGVGLEIQVRDGFATVMAPIPGGPGAARGIRAGDQIVRVGDESTSGWDVDRMGEALRGKAGTEVEIGLRRPGSELPIAVTLERAEIHLSAVPFVSLLEEGIGYVPVQVFRETVSSEVRTAVDSLESLGAHSVILDLRGNPGGLLEEGIAVTDLFLPPGAAIVETRRREGADGEREMYTAGSPDRYEGLRIFLLVDDGSASASEIVAGALQDHDRATLVGTRTYGKGSVQTLFPLSAGQVLKLTTAHWFTPSGRSIQPEERVDSAWSVREDDVVSLEGRLVRRSSTEGRPTYESFGGETLYGGGGITPNEIVLPDTMSVDEVEALGSLIEANPSYYTILFDFAVDYLQERPAIGIQGELDEDVLERFVARLGEQAAEVATEVMDEVRRPLLYQIGREIAVQGWGAEGEFDWLRQYDPQLARALELARVTAAGEESLTPGG